MEAPIVTILMMRRQQEKTKKQGLEDCSACAALKNSSYDCIPFHLIPFQLYLHFVSSSDACSFKKNTETFPGYIFVNNIHLLTDSLIYFFVHQAIDAVIFFPFCSSIGLYAHI